MRNTTQQKILRRKRRIAAKLARRKSRARSDPMFAAANIHYQMADRALGLGGGGIGVVHQLARASGLIDTLDARVKVLKVHLPYHESDHVLNIAYNTLAGGTCLDHLELLRNDEGYLKALGAQRIPDPTTAGGCSAGTSGWRRCCDCRRRCAGRCVVKQMRTDVGIGTSRSAAASAFQRIKLTTTRQKSNANCIAKHSRW